MCHAQKLYLYNNDIGDAGIEALAKATINGAMANVTFLDLSVNQIGDNGMAAFAQAIKPTSEGGSGALAQLTWLSLTGNPASQSAQQAAKDAIKNRK